MPIIKPAAQEGTCRLHGISAAQEDKRQWKRLEGWKGQEVK